MRRFIRIRGIVRRFLRVTLLLSCILGGVACAATHRVATPEPVDPCTASLARSTAMPLEREDSGDPAVCQYVSGAPGWRQAEEQSESSAPEYSLRLWCVKGNFEQAAQWAGLYFDSGYSGADQGASTDVPHEHPDPAMARYWCTPARMRTLCGSTYISGKGWSGFKISSEFGFHLKGGGYLGTIDACRAAVEGSNGLSVGVSGIGSCEPVDRFLASLDLTSRKD